MKIYMITNPESINKHFSQSEWDLIIVDEKAELSPEQMDFVRTRLRPRNEIAGVVTGKVHHEETNTRWVIQTKADDCGHQVVETNAIRMKLTEEQIELLYEIFDSSDKVLSAICGRKKQPSQ